MNIINYIKIFFLTCIGKDKKQKKDNNIIEMKNIKYNLSTIIEE